MMAIETARLRLRPLVDADVPAYTAIRLKPSVTQYLPSHTDDPVEAAQRAAGTVEVFKGCWAADGYGPWAVEERGTGQLVGHLGLRWLADLGETELLFLLDPDVQGRGYATEGGRAALDFGFGTLGLERVIAMALPDNAGSLAVLERLGMVRRPGLFRAFGLDAIRYDATSGPA